MLNDVSEKYLITSPRRCPGHGHDGQFGGDVGDGGVDDVLPAQAAAQLGHAPARHAASNLTSSGLTLPLCYG